MRNGAKRTLSAPSMGIYGLLVLAVALLSLFMLLQKPTEAALPPTTMNFQGRLADSSGNLMPDGLYNMQFRLFSVSSGGSAVWTETRETTNRVQVTNGLFSIQLGEATPLSASLFNATDLYFEITMATPATANCATASCATWESPMTPRQKLATSAYAFNSATLNGKADTDFGQLAVSNTWTGTNTVRATDVAAFQVQNAGGTTLLGVDTSAMRVQVNSGNTMFGLQVGENITGRFVSIGYENQVSVLSPGDAQKTGFITAPDSEKLVVRGNLGVEGGLADQVSLAVRAASGQTANIFSLQNNSDTVLASVSATGAAFFRNTSDSATAFQVQNAGGTSVLSLDTLTGRLSVVGSDGALVLHDTDAPNTWEINQGSSGDLYFALDGGERFLLDGTNAILGGLNTNGPRLFFGDRGAHSYYGNVYVGEYNYTPGSDSDSLQAFGRKGIRLSVGRSSGTVSQSGTTTVTGVGTNFDASMVGLTLTYADGISDTITGYVSPTEITVSTARTHASSNFRIIRDALLIDEDGAVMLQQAKASTSVFQVQGAASASILNVNSVHNTIGINYDNTSSTDATLGIVNTTAANDVLSLQGASNQSGYALKYQNALSQNLFRFYSDGSLYISHEGTNSQSSIRVEDVSNRTLFNINSESGFIALNGDKDTSGNLLQDGGFEGGSTFTWQAALVTSGDGIYAESANARTANNVLKIAGSGSSTDIKSQQWFAVTPGDDIYFEGYVKSIGGNGDAGFYLEFRDKDKSSGSATYVNAYTGTPSSSYELRTITTTTSPTACNGNPCQYVRPAATKRSNATAGTYYFDDLYLTTTKRRAPVAYQNTVDSTSAFAIQNAGGSSLLNVSTTEQRLTLGETIDFDTPTDLADPATLPGNNVRTTAWSPDGQYLSVGGLTTTADRFTIYKRTGDTFTKLPDPASMPGNNVLTTAWSPDGQYLSVGSDTTGTDRFTIYKRTGDTFTKLPDPASMPGNTVYTTAWSADSTYLSVGSDTAGADRFTIYKRSGDTFTELSDPTSMPGNNVRTTAWSPDGQYLSVGSSTVGTDRLTIYKRSGDTFTKLADPASLPGSSVQTIAWSPDGQYMSTGSFTATVGRFNIYKRSGDTFTQLADPASMPGTNVRTTAWSPDGQYLSVGSDVTSADRFIIYKRSGDTFTKLADPSNMPGSYVLSTAWSPDGQYLSVGSEITDATRLTIYKGSGARILSKSIGNLEVVGNISATGLLQAGSAYIQSNFAVGSMLSVQDEANMVVIGQSAVDGTSLFTADANNMTITINGDVNVASGNTLRVLGDTNTNIQAYGTPLEGQVTYDTDNNQLLVYTNGKWKADSTDAILVAASNSSQADKNAADYVVDGTADQAEINTALTAGSGKKVVLLAGTYTVDGSISIPNNTTLSGVGRGTRIEFASLSVGATLDMIVNTDTNTSTSGGVVVRDMVIDGRDDLNNIAGTQHGIRFTNLGDGSGISTRSGARVANVHAEDFRSYGIYLTSSDNSVISGSSSMRNTYGIAVSGSQFVSISDNSAQGNSNSGIYVINSSDNTVTGNTSEGNSIYGISISASSGNTVTGNTVIGSTSFGIYLQSSSNNNTVTGNTSQGNSNGIRLSSAGNNTVAGNKVADSTSSGIYLVSSAGNNLSSNQISDSAGASDNNGVHLNSSDSNHITGNTITDTQCDTTCYAINLLDSASDDNYLANNVFSDTDVDDDATINDAGTGTIYAGQAMDAGGLNIRFRQPNSNNAFAVQNTSASKLFSVDTANARVFIGETTSGQTATAKLYFGDVGTVNNIWIGEQGGTDSDILELQGKNGIHLSINNNNDTAFSLDGTGNALFQTNTNSTTAFQVQNTGGTSLLTADSTNSRIQVGSSTADSTAIFFVLDQYNQASDPAGGANGAMYYNTNTNKNRCYENGGWKDCITGYAINVQALTSSPADGATTYFGTLPKAPTTTAATSKIYFRKAGTIRMAEIYNYSGTAGTGEAWSLYIRKNNTTDTLISTVSAATNERVFSNSSLSISVAAGDYIEIKSVQPTWATNPLTSVYGGYIYVE